MFSYLILFLFIMQFPLGINKVVIPLMTCVLCFFSLCVGDQSNLISGVTFIPSGTGSVAEMLGVICGMRATVTSVHCSSLSC